MQAEVKQCRRCDEIRSTEMFSPRAAATDGFDSHCKVCNRERSRRYKERNAEVLRERNRLAAAKRRLENPRYVRNAQLLSTYGIGLEDRERMEKEQDGLCSICQQPPSGNPPAGQSLHIDHCHVTGVVRSLLCGKCNTALGLFSDDPSLLRGAADYLEKWRGHAS